MKDDAFRSTRALSWPWASPWQEWVEVVLELEVVARVMCGAIKPIYLPDSGEWNRSEL